TALLVSETTPVIEPVWTWARAVRAARMAHRQTKTIRPITLIAPYLSRECGVVRIVTQSRLYFHVNEGLLRLHFDRRIARIRRIGSDVRRCSGASRRRGRSAHRTGQAILHGLSQRTR